MAKSEKTSPGSTSLEKPGETAFYNCVENHFEGLETFLDDLYASRYGFWRPYIKDMIWGDENAPYFAVNYLPIFVPRKLSRTQVRERRAGGLKPWPSGMVQSLFTPAPFELVRSPTHRFPSRRGVIRSKKRRIGGENGGLDSLQDCRSSVSREVGLATAPGYRPTHPTIPTQPVQVTARGEQIPAEKIGPGAKFGSLDSGSTLHVPVRKFPEATESVCFIDTRGACRSARNDDRRDDSS